MLQHAAISPAAAKEQLDGILLETAENGLPIDAILLFGIIVSIEPRTDGWAV